MNFQCEVTLLSELHKHVKHLIMQQTDLVLMDLNFLFDFTGKVVLLLVGPLSISRLILFRSSGDDSPKSKVQSPSHLQF